MFQGLGRRAQHLGFRVQGSMVRHGLRVIPVLGFLFFAGLPWVVGCRMLWLRFCMSLWLNTNHKALIDERLRGLGCWLPATRVDI